MARQTVLPGYGQIQEATARQVILPGYGQVMDTTAAADESLLHHGITAMPNPTHGLPGAQSP